MSSDAKTYQAFLIRLWHVREARDAWRFSVEDAHTHELRGFADLEALFAFLREQTLAAPDPLDDVEPGEGKAAGGVRHA